MAAHTTSSDQPCGRPQDLAAETDVLSACLQQSRWADLALQTLEVGDFADEAHQTIFTAIRRLRQTGAEADVGSVWLPDTYFLSTTLNANLSGQIWGITSWSPASLTVDGTWVRFAEPGFVLDVDGNVLVNGTLGRLEIGGNAPVNTWGENMLVSEGDAPEMVVGGNFELANGAVFSVFATATNPPAVTVGARVDVTGDIVLGADCKVYVHSHHTNGGSPRFTADDVTVAGPEAEEELGVGFFGSRFERATPGEREYLRAMADVAAELFAAGEELDDSESVPTSAVAKHLGRRPQSLSPARDGLLKKGLIYSGERGRIAFTVPHFGKYLRNSA